MHWLTVLSVGRQKWLTFSLAGAIHAGILAGGNAAFVRAPQYGVESGFAGSEIELVAAPLSADPETTDALRLERPKEPEAITVPQIEEGPNPEPVRPEARGDGSSPAAGLDATTQHAGSGAFTQAEPGYRRNPAPAYPAEARRRQQEGVVLLLVEVSQEGHPAAVTIRSSSGFPLLDGAARDAVRRWSFSPARVGSLAVSSRVEIPIRFELND
jgi:TonB family protein